MPSVRLEPMTLENWEECSRLEVDPSQRAFVAPNLYILARAQFFPEVNLRAIYDEAGRIVGQAVFSREPGDGRWKIRTLMIDARFQQRGYGRAALARLMAEINARPDGDQILIGYHNDNQVARRLYASVGFVEQSIVGVKVTALWTRGYTVPSE